MIRDAYGYAKKVGQYVRTIDLWASSKANAELIKDTYEVLLAENLSLARILIYLARMKAINKLLKKDFDQFTAKDVRHLIAQHRTNGNKDKTIKLSLDALRKIGKNFIPSLLGAVNEVKFRAKKRPVDCYILNRDEIELMIGSCSHLRDKAFIAVIYERPVRPSEILGVRKLDVLFDQYGARVKTEGKTGAGVKRIVGAGRYLANYLDTYCKHLRSTDCIWYSLTGKNKGKPVDAYAMLRMVKKAAKQIGIKDSISIYSFRHAATDRMLDEGYTKEQVNVISDRNPFSPEIERYSHRKYQEVDEDILRKSGLTPDNSKKRALKPKICTGCELINNFDAKMCGRCGFSLDIKAEQERRAKTEEMENFMKRLINNPKFVEMVKEEYGDTELPKP